MPPDPSIDAPFLRVGLVGAGARGRRRARTLVALPSVHFVGVVDAEKPRADALAASHGARVFTSVPALLDSVDVLCVAAPTRDHFVLAQTAARENKDVFLEWPPATSVQEGEALAALAEEAGIDVGVSSPWQVHPLFDVWPPGWVPGLIQLSLDPALDPGDRRSPTPVPSQPEEATDEPFNWSYALADALGLCSALVGSGAVQRIDAQAVRGRGVMMEAVACTLRFHKGTYAQVSIRRSGGRAERRLYLAGGDRYLDVDLSTGHLWQRQPGAGEADAPAVSEHRLPEADLLHAEFVRFLTALAGNQRVPVSILEALQTMRLVERLLAKLR